MTPKTLILWLHVVCGTGWVGACLTFLLGSSALAGQPVELRAFVGRVAPRINRIGRLCAVLIPLTGLANLAFAASNRNFRLPSEFIAIVVAKIAMFALMGWSLWRATTIVALRAQVETSDGNQSRRLAHCYGAIVGCGATALLLGLWLSGL